MLSNFSTYIREGDLQAVIKLCGSELRSFLAYAAGKSSNSVYQKSGNTLNSVEDAIIKIAKDYQSLSDDILVKKGENFEDAVKNPVRIEVRRSKELSGAAQIAVRGIFGDFRSIALKQLKKNKVFDKLNISVSGNASFEINISGVNKALALKYLKKLKSG